jgi:hypothetical protein
VLDCAADANDLRPVFEPLHPAESQLASRYAYEVMQPEDRDEVLEAFFRDLAAGQRHSRWIDYRGRRDYLFPNPTSLLSSSAARKWLRRWRKYFQDRSMLRAAARRKDVLIKCIRANLMAGWLTKAVGFKTVLVVRHPGAVVESQLRLGSVWDPAPVIERYRANPRLHEATGGRYLSLLNSKLTTLQALTLVWVIENQGPVERSVADGYAVVYYENLLSQPDSVWRYLCEALDLPRVPSSSILHKPSQQASLSPEIPNKLDRSPPRWRTRMTPEQLGAIQGILSSTECNLYHINRDGPLC